MFIQNQYEVMGGNMNVRIAVHDNKDHDKNCSKHGTEHGTIILDAWFVWCMVTVLEQHYPCQQQQQPTNHFPQNNCC
jgi:hypothetical protein